MRYLLPLFLAVTLLACGDPAPAAGDEARDPSIDSAEKYLQLYQTVKESNLPFASAYSDLALTYASRSNYQPGMADANTAKGHVQCKLNRFDLSLQSLNEALKQYELSNDTSGIAESCYYLAEVYSALKNYDEAVSSANRAISLREAQHNFAKSAEGMRLLGKIHTQKGEYPFAFTDFEESIYNERQHGDTLGVVKAIAGLGSAYTASGDADQGLAKHLIALKKLDSLSGDVNVAEASIFKATLLNEMAGEYFLSGDYGQAIKTGEAGLELANSFGAREQKCAAYKTLAELQGLAGREDIQMQYMEKYIALNDSIAKDVSDQWKAASAMRYQLAQADVEAARKEAADLEVKLTEEIANAERNLMILMIVSVVVLAGLAVVLVVQRKKMQK